MRNLPLISLFILLASSLFNEVKAQKSWIDTTIHDGLVELNTTYSFKVLVSNDSLKTPTETLKNLNAAKHFFDSVIETDLDFAVMFIENKKWNTYAYFPPPGLPQAGKGNIILGIEKSVISMEVENMITQLPEQAWATLKPVYGDTLNLDLFYREVLAIHELAHLYHFKEGTKPQRKWLQELFATMSMYAFIKDKAIYYSMMNAYPEFVLQSGDRMAEFKTLQDFEEKYVQKLTPQNYEWYQMQLYQYSKDIMDSNKPDILKRLHAFLIATDMSTINKLTDSELIQHLERKVGKDVANVLRNWKYK